MVLTVLGIVKIPLFSGEHQMRRVVSLSNKAPSTTLKFSPSPTILTSDNLSHHLNALAPKNSTFPGIVIDVKDVHQRNALHPIRTTESGIASNSNLVQSLKALAINGQNRIWNLNRYQPLTVGKYTIFDRCE